jgi:hypothetical protein
MSAWGFVGFVGSALAAIVLGALPAGRLSERGRAFGGAAALLVFAASITQFVFSEDTYVADASSKWSNRGFSEHLLYVIVAASAVADAVLLVDLAVRKAKAAWVRPLLVFTGSAAFVTGWAVLVAFAAN